MISIIHSVIARSEATKRSNVNDKYNVWIASHTLAMTNEVRIASAINASQ